jgi:hypothetical protein
LRWENIRSDDYRPEIETRARLWVNRAPTRPAHVAAAAAKLGLAELDFNSDATNQAFFTDDLKEGVDFGPMPRFLY